MRYIKFTYIDAQTGSSIAKQPAFNGTKFPSVPGLEFVWARESAYPTEVPEFFGTCPDDSDIQVEGVLGEFLQADWEQMRANEMAGRPTLRDAQKTQRGEKVNAITVTTAAGNTFDGDEVSQTRMVRAVVVLSAGAAQNVPWVLTDNTTVMVDVAELTEALALAGAAQSALWVLDTD